MKRSIGKSSFEIIYGFHPRGIFELRGLKYGTQGSGYVEDFSQSMREVHESVNETLTENANKLKKKVDASKREVWFQIGDLVMVHLNKKIFPKGIPHKL